MFRQALIAATLLATATTARAHFVFVLCSEDRSSIKVVLSDGLEVDDDIDAAKIAGTKLFVRGSDGKDAPITCKADKHHLDAKLPGSGSRLVFGTTDYGVLQKGEGKPFQLKYHSKAIVGELTPSNAKVGEAVPVELIPVLDGGKIRFQLLAKGKPVADVEVTVLLPGDKNEKVKTDKDGFTQSFEGKGRYGAWARHFETKAGQAGDKKFEEIRHYATLVIDVDNSKLPDLPVGFSSFGAAVVGDSVYVYGGHAGKAHSYSTETTIGELRRLDLNSPTKWEELPGGPKMQGLALVAHDGKLYRIGGMQPQNSKTEKSVIRSLATCAVFNPTTSKWTDISPLPEPRSSHDAVVVDNSIYVFGGWTLSGSGKGEWIEHGLRLDLSTEGAKWEKVSQPFQRRALTAAALGGRIYVIGGMNGSNKLERTVNVFDCKVGTWSEGPSIPGEDLNGFTPASATRDNRIYLTTRDGKVFRLSESSDRWDAIGTLQTARFVARMVPGRDRSLVVIAGAAPGGMLASVECVQISDR